MRVGPLAFLTTELNTFRDQGLHRSLRILEGRQQASSQFDGRTVVNLSSNNYLGLTTHPGLVGAAIQAVRDFGVGSGSVRTIAGSTRWRRNRRLLTGYGTTRGPLRPDWCLWDLIRA